MRPGSHEIRRAAFKWVCKRLLPGKPRLKEPIKRRPNSLPGSRFIREEKEKIMIAHGQIRAAGSTCTQRRTLSINSSARQTDRLSSCLALFGPVVPHADSRATGQSLTSPHPRMANRNCPWQSHGASKRETFRLVLHQWCFTIEHFLVAA